MIGKLRKICLSALVVLLTTLAAVLCIKFSSLTAKAVSDFNIDYVPIESVEVSAPSTELRQGQSVELSVKLTPEYAKDTVQNVSYKIIGGSAFAYIEDNALTVKADATIGGVITIEAFADNVKSSNRLTFKIIANAVESVKIANTETTLAQGGSLQLQTVIEPYNATNKKISYTVIKGAEYATVSAEGLVRANSALPAGDIKITVKAISLSDVTKYDIIELDLYVPTRTLSLKADNVKPCPSETITLMPVIDTKATVAVPEYTILSGEEYVKELNGNTLTIIDTVTDFSPSIVIRADRDGLAAELKLNLYVPTETLSVVADKQAIKQGEMLQLGALVNPANATLANLHYFLDDESNNYASVSDDGILAAKILVENSTVEVKVYAQIDGVVSEAFIVTVEKPNVVLSADNFYPNSSDVYGDTVILSTLVDGAVQTSGVNYVIKSGSEFVNGAISGNILKVKSGISAYNPKIVLSAKVGEFESGDVIINVKILAQSISLSNTSVTEVEQQRSYSFKGSILPLNATLVNGDINYSLNVGEDIAEIDVEGVLSVKPLAPIGQHIIITAEGPDGAVASHTVTVKTVYATSLEITGAYKTDGTQLHADNLARPSDVIYFDVEFPEPFNVTQSQKVYLLSLISGDTGVAKIEGNTVVINSQITKPNPSFVVRVSSIQNGTVIFEDYTITVFIPVTDVVLSAKTSFVNEGARVRIDSILNTAIYPLNSDVRTADYEIVSGGNYVRLDGDYIVVDDNLGVGDLTFTLRAVADGITSNEVEFGIYVKTQNLTVTASNYSPVSKINSGEVVTLTSVTDARATSNSPVITVVSGAEYIDGNYKNGNTIGNAFAVKKNLTAIGVSGAIKLVAEQDGVSCRIDDIIVYVPVEKISLGLPTTADRDSTLELKPIYNGISNAYVSTPGYTVNVSGATLTGTKLYIGKTLNAGNKVTLTYKSKEAGATAVTSVITVNPLVNSFGKVYGTPSSYPAAFSIAYGNVIKNDNSVQITSAMQVEEGGYTDIVVRYNGQPLLDYGMTSYSLIFVSGSTYTNVLYLSNGTIRLSVNSNVDGTNYIDFYIQVMDGTQPYTSGVQRINVFKKFTEKTLSKTYITNKETQLSVYLGSGASAVTNLKFDTYVSGTGCALTAAGKFTVTSTSATYNPVVRYTAVQNYNGEKYDIDASVTLDINKIDLDLQGGTSKYNYVIAVANLTNAAPEVSKTGYLFTGYYTSASGGTQFYSSTGEVVRKYPYYTATKLYAQWSPIMYKVKIHIYKDGNSWEHDSKTYVYDISYNYTAPSYDGYHFTQWCDHDDGDSYIHSNQTFTFYKTTSKDYAVLNYVACYEKNESKSCVADGTLITLADGSMKAVEDLDGSELLLVWNLNTGSYDAAPILFVDSHGVSEYEVIRLIFSDGTEVKVIDEHGFWDFNLNKYVFLDGNANQYIGHWFNKQSLGADGENAWTRVQLTEVVIEAQTTNAWSPVTFGHLCYYVDGMLSMPARTEGFINIFEVNAETMKIDESAMAADIEKYGLFTYEEFAEILPVPELIFEAFSGQYLKVSIGKGLITWEEIYSLIQDYSKFFSDC
ncbi:MAG: Ig-like domain-containing protein [Clostridia bacterium]|nr:Ig-like domain-containing protein [Clostridia bacterium]